MSRPRIDCEICGGTFESDGAMRQVEFLEFEAASGNFLTDEKRDVCPKCWESIGFLFGGGEEE